MSGIDCSGNEGSGEGLPALRGSGVDRFRGRNHRVNTRTKLGRLARK